MRTFRSTLVSLALIGNLTTMTSTAIGGEKGVYGPLTSSITWVKAFEEARFLLGTKALQLEASNEDQSDMIRQYHTLREHLSKLPEGQTLEGLASNSVLDVNDFLKKNGIDGQLPELPGLNNLYAAAVLKLQDKWSGNTGERAEIEQNGRVYPAVKLNSAQYFCFRMPNHPNPIANLGTEGKGSLVYISMLTENQIARFKQGRFGRFEVLNLAKSLTPREEQVSTLLELEGFTSVSIPMVDMTVDVDSTWILEMKIQGDPIAAALQVFSLKLDEFGFEAKDGVAFGVPRGFSQVYEFNRPFIFWVTGDKLNGQPIVAVIVTEDNWKDPKSSTRTSYR